MPSGASTASCHSEGVSGRGGSAGELILYHHIYRGDKAAGFDDPLDLGELTRKSIAIDTVVTLQARLPDAQEQASIETRIAGQIFKGVYGFIHNMAADM